MNDAAEVIYDLVDAQANLIFGAVVDPTMKNGEVRLKCSKPYLRSMVAFVTLSLFILAQQHNTADNALACLRSLVLSHIC